jgi:protein TonB
MQAASHTKSIAMTNKEILQADMLDILFEHRNKLYGAYALRKTYSQRLGRSLGIALTIVLAFITFSFMKNEKGNNRPGHEAESTILTEVNLEEKIKEPERPRNEPKPPVATADHQNIIIAPDIEATDIPDQKQIETSAISNVNADGAPPEDPAKGVTQTEGNGNNTEKVPEKPVQPELPSRPPAFPGGTEAWLDFLRKFLQAPEDLEPGQRIEVMVKFWVGIDGVVSNAEIIKSGGKAFDKEVLRVMKKMPKWEPAIQHGNHVAVAYTQPVIFLGVEE